MMTETPAQLGYRMPAEWEPHEATWIAWPHNRDDWPGKFAPIPWVYTEIVRHLSRVERVNIVVKGRKMQAERPTSLDTAGVDLGRVEFVKAATDRVWLRDSGPTFLVNDRRRGRRGPRRAARLEVQRLGEVRQPSATTTASPDGWRAGSACAAGCRGSRSRGAASAS